MKLFVFTLFLLSSCFLIAQVQEIDRKGLKAEMFKLDKLGNFYFVENNVLTKTDKDLSPLCTFDEFSWGEITLIDVSDPLRVLVFYKDFNRVIYLDKNFAELRDPILLDDIEYFNISVLATSQQGGFWIFDNQKAQVVSLDQNLSISQKGTNLYALTNGAEVTDMQISTDYIVLKTQQNTILILDKFANYYSQVQSNVDSPFCLDNNLLYTLEDNSIYVLDINTKITDVIELPLSDIKDFEISGSKIFVLSENSLITFQIL